jgi:hypothetical protein
MVAGKHTFLTQPRTIEAASGFVEMDTTVREHIKRLKARIDLLDRYLMDDQRTENERQTFLAELGFASLALAHYEAAIREEHKLAPLSRAEAQTSHVS